MIGYTVEASLHTPTGRVELLADAGGSFAFDRSWAPQGAGSVTAALGPLVLDALQAGQPDPIVLRLEVAATSGTPISALQLPSTDGTIATAYWPGPTPATFTFHSDEPTTSPDAVPPAWASWYVWPLSIERDETAGTATIQLATIEHVLQQRQNLSGEGWAPVALHGAGYNVATALQQLLYYLGLPARVVEAGAPAVVPFDEMEPWLPGETAWDWWDRLRIAAGATYTLDATTNTFRVGPRSTPTPYAPDPQLVLEHRAMSSLEVAADEFVPFAEGLVLTWRWEQDGQPREQRDVVLAAGVADWRDVRRTQSIDRAGRPIAGYAQRLVDEMARWHTIHAWLLPLQPQLLLQLQDAGVQSIAYDLGAQPRVELTTLED